MMPFFSCSEFFSNNIIHVDDDGGADYTRIQDAIDAARSGDTVFIYSGVYNDCLFDSECIKINKRINLFGEDKYNTIIDKLD